MRRVRNKELRKNVLSLLEKLSSGWRQSEKERTHAVLHSGGSFSRFVEHYKVNKQLYLVWAVDILREISHCTQVLKVWDILPLSDMPNLSNQLDIFYGSYTMEQMTRCMHKFSDGYAPILVLFCMFYSFFKFISS